MPTPREILLSVEDNIDHPAHVIHHRLVDRALEALDAAGFVIIPKEPSEMVLSVLYALDGQTSGSDRAARETYQEVIAAAKA